MATDIPDLRIRLGIGDTEVFGGQGFSLGLLQLRVRLGCCRVVARLRPVCRVSSWRGRGRGGWSVSGHEQAHPTDPLSSLQPSS